MDHFADVNADVKSDVNADINVDLIADVTIPPPKAKPDWTRWLSLIFIFVSAIIAWKSKEIVHFLINTFNDLKHRFYKPAAPASAICKSDLMNDFIGAHMQSHNDALSQMEEMIVDSTQGEASESSHIPFHTTPESMFSFTSEAPKPAGSVELPYECEEYDCELDQVLEEASIPEKEERQPLAPLPTPEHVPSAPNTKHVTVLTALEPPTVMAPEQTPVHRAEPAPEPVPEPVPVREATKPDVSVLNEVTEEAPASTEPVHVQEVGDTKKTRKRKPKMAELVD